IVHRDRISLTVLEDGLLLWPRIMFITGTGGSRDMTVTLKRATGAEVDVSKHPDTEYGWIGKSDGSLASKAMNTIGVALANRALAKLKTKSGQSLGLKLITKFSVTKGRLTAGAPGIQLVWSVHKGIPSNYSLIFVGLGLQSIEIEPMRLAPGTLPQLVTDVFSLAREKNHPLVLTSDANGWVSDKGQLWLTDMRFGILNKGPSVSVAALGAAAFEVVKALSLPALTAALAPEVGPPAAPFVARAVMWAGGKLAASGASYAATNALAFQSLNTGVVSVSNAGFGWLTIPSLGGYVQSGSSGITGVRGTLDLGWLGKASDTVLIWVLPDLETVQIETIGDPPGHHTAPILIDVNGPRWPGPPARAFAETVLTNSSDIPLPKSVRPGVDVVKGFLPAALWASHAINFERTVPGTRFRLSLKGSYQVTDKGPKSVVVVFRDLKMGFHVPNNITGVSTVATSNDWALENPSLGTVDPRDTFDAYILHNNAGGTGDTNITSTVAFSGMGSAKGKRVVRFLKDEIIIRPPSRTIVLGVTPGNEARYRAIKRYADGREEDVTTRATWVGSNNAVARMEPGGRAVGLSPGEITLTASEGRLTSDPATLKVIEQVASCLVDPDDKQVKPGDTVTYTVSVTYISGATASVATGITWSSSDTNVADIAADGVATAKAIGDTNIGADLSGITCTPGLLKVRKKPDASAKIDLDLSIVGVPEDREESVGGHVRLNRDDDNANKIEDRADKGAVKGENDLVALTLRVDLSKPDIPVRLEATKGAAKIRVWRDPGRASELPLPFTWESQGESWLAGGGTTEALVPKRLFVEGIQTSGSLADVGLQLSAGTGPGWLTGGAKDADSVTLTVVDLDVSIADLEPEKETGVHIGYNDDDDDRDDKVDLGNSSRPVKNEDDTRAIDVTVQPNLPTGRAKVQLNVKPGVKLWRNALADNLFADPATTPVTKTLGEADQKKKRFFAEGVNLKPPPSEISLEVAIAGASGDWMDKINLAVARADISIADFADSGEEEYWEGGYVAKSTKPTPDEKELTTLLLSASVSAGKFGPDTCIDLAIVKGIGDFRLFTKTGGTLKPLTIINCPAGGFKPAALPKKIHVQGLNATADRGIELQLRFWEKTTKGTFGIVHRDRISLTVLEEELRLRPRLVFIPGKSGERDLSAILKRRSGTEVEVRAHPDTRYHWIGKAYPGDSLAVRVMKAATLAAANKMLVAINKSALKKYGTSPGLKLITKFDVDKGKIKAGEPGMQIVWATHNGLQSNATIVFVGLVLESIQLEPEPVSRLTMSHILTRSLGGLTTKNKPLVLSTDDNGWLADKGQILLEEMTFQLLEKGPKIPLGAVTIALTEFARKLSLGPLTLAFSETGVLAPYLADIVSHGVSGVARKTTKYIATNLVTYESTDKSIATVTNAAFSLTKGAALGGFVQSGVSGFVGIKGTLDAGKLGKALDTVITWVLPDLETVDIETKNDPPGDHTAPILIDTQKPAKPGPAVRAFARTNITKASEIEFDKKAAVKSLKAAGTILPKALLTLGPLAFGTTVDLSGTVAASTFRLEITGTIGLADKGPKKAAIQFRDFKIGFHVPNNIAGFDKVLLRNDWSIKDPPIVRIDPDNIEWFDVHILHKGPDQTGKTEIATIVSLAGMGSASGTRPVETRKDELVVTPPTATIVLGVTPDDAAQYKATRKYADGREEDVSDRATWSGDDDAIARLERGGRAIGLVPGEIKLQATEGGLTSNQAELIVTQNPASCVVAPSEAQAQIGETVTFTAVATFSSGATGAVTSNVRWASGVSTVATVAGGEATALTEGETDIFASFAEIKCAPAKLTVSRDIITGPPLLNPVFTHAGAAVALGDLDGDGDLDAFVANFGNPNIVWLNNGDGSFDWSGERLSNRRSTDVALADLDGDGDLDAYVTNFNQYDRIWLNNGKGLFKVARTELDQGRGRSVALGDIDKDGEVDAFVAREGQPDRIWLNTGRDGQLTEDKTAMEAIDSDSMGVALGDIDQDGDLDAIVVTDHGASNELWLNESSRFSLAEQGPGKGISRAVVLADLDDDGDKDIFVVNAAGDGNEIWLNLAGDLFDSGQRLDSIQGADADAGDLDGDGDRDVYVASDGRGNRIWLNDGAGAFEDSKEDLGRAKSTGIALGDLDGDGDLDAFVVNDGEPDHVWMNEDFGKSSR
ncbi:MAG: hypothetical protein GY850_30965, partial [bacterium]|nr:hypothetical protein [bacterium]